MRKPVIALSLVLAALVAASALSPAAHAYPAKPFQRATASLGIAVGHPAAIDLKIWTGQGSGFDFGIGFHRFSDRVGVYGEYELGLADFYMGDSVHGVFYLGIGGAMALRHRRDDLQLSLIIPIGLNFRFRAPVEIFLEARPGFELLDSDGFGIGGQLGVRFVF